VDGCEFESNSGPGVSIHAAQKNPEKDISFTNKTEFVCPECGEQFKDYESRRSSKDEKNNFCSRNCKYEFERNGKIVECSLCSEEVYKPTSVLSEMGDYAIDNHFCDKTCEKEWKRLNWQGKDHPSWNGGSPKHRGGSWLEVRREAISRDEFECVVCGMTRKEHHEQYGQDLDVHHKIPARTFEDPDDANYLVNLITTCRSCHGKLDTVSRREADKLPTIA